MKSVLIVVASFAVVFGLCLLLDIPKVLTWILSTVAAFAAIVGIVLRNLPFGDDDDEENDGDGPN